MPRLFLTYPDLFNRVSEVLGAGFSSHTTVTTVPLVVRPADGLLRVEAAGNEPFLVAVQGQNTKDATLPAQWARQVAALTERYGLRATLLVVSQDRATAEWTVNPLPAGTSPTLRPLVLGPHNVPMITAPVKARKDLALAVLSAITHADDPGVGDILRSLSAALREAPESLTGPLVELTAQGLGKRPAAQQWRNLVAVGLSFYTSPLSEEIRDEGRSRGRSEGRAESRAEDILLVLGERGIPVPDEARVRITTCTDLDVLREWLLRSLTASAVEDVFATEQDAGYFAR